MEDLGQLKGKVYFVSDLHLGVPDSSSSLTREKKFTKWLEQISHDADHVFILGDLFDFWFEYRKVVPRGFVRVLGKLAELRDRAIPITFFTGNHDQWMTDYFQKELSIPVYHAPQEISIAGKNFLIGHGDGLGTGDHGYKFLKRIFRSRFARWLYSQLHPNLGISLGQYWSRNNRLISGEDSDFLGQEKEWLIGYSKEVLKKKNIDFFIFGHRHLMLDFPLKDNSRYINLGDWIKFSSYAVFDGSSLELKSFNPQTRPH